ncbi:MAG: retention module-containing protein [Cycloclasticus sp.]
MKPTGIIQSVSGVVKAVALDGTERILNVGDVVELNEQVITGASGAVVIALSDGTTMKIGHDETVTLNADTSPTEAQSDVAEIQAALQTDPNFDPSELPATAAGNPAAGGAGNSGSSFVEVDYDKSEAEVTSGFETKGIEQQFNEGSEGDGIIDSVPTAGTITVMLDEDDLAVAEFDDAHYEVLELAFETATGLDAQRASSEGANDEALGDDLTPPSPTVLSGALVADFGADGPGDIVFNLAGTQPTGLSSAGEALQYHVSADGHSLIAYILTEEAIDGDGPVSTVAEIIFSAEITDVDAGLFRVELYGPLDHPDGSTEDNLLIDLGFTISDVDGDTASGVLRLDIDDDSPVIETMEEHFDGFTGEIDSDEIESLSTARVDEDDIDPEGNGDNQAGDDDGFPGAILPINFGADGPAADNAVVLNAEGIVDQNGNALTSNGVELEYTWDSVTDSLTGRANGEEVMTLSVGMIDDADEEFVVLYVDLYGNLDHPDGSTEDNLIIDVSYTATDSDGDSVVGSFNVDIDDDSPVIITPENSSVDEEGLDGNLGNSYEDGGDLAGEEVTASGSLGIQWGADDNNDGGSFDRSATFDDQDAPEGLSSNGLAISYLISEDGLTLTGYTGDDASVEASWVFTVALSDLESGSYSFELLGNLDHGVANTEDDIDLSFAFTATDSDGDTASSSFTVTVDDDSPVIITPENSRVDEEGLDGNAGDSYGADGSSGVAVQGAILDAGEGYTTVDNWTFHHNGGALTIDVLSELLGGDLDDSGAVEGVDLVMYLFRTSNQDEFIAESDDESGSDPKIELEDLPAGDYVLAISDWPFVSSEAFDATQESSSDFFGDGNFGPYQITFDTEIELTGMPVNGSLIDGDLASGIADDLAGEEVTASGSLGIQWGADDNNDGGSFDRSATFDDQDAPEGLSSNGLAISYLISEDGLTLTGYTGDDASVEASWVFTVALSDLESGSYSFELLGNLDHGVANTEDDIDLSFAFTATDSDGDTASSSFTVTVDDDAAILVSATDDLLADEDSLENANNDDGREGEVTAATVLTGNLADNFNFGADGAAAQAIYSVNGELADEGDITITGMNYELVIDAASGDYTFTLTDNILDSVEGGDVENLVDDAIQAVLEVVVEDADGDRIEGTVSLNVDVQDDIPVIILGESKDSAAEFTIDNHDEVSSAGYHNSYGYYVRTLDADGNVLSGEPTVGVIIENDAHAEHGGFAEPVTVTGYSQEQIGYFIIPNGGGLNSGLDGGEVVSFAEVGGQWQAFAADESAIMGAGSAVLFDVSALNSDGKDHMQGDELVGDQNWEDLQIPGDDGDYNDLYVNVEWTGVTVSGDVVEEVSFGADGEGSIDFSLDEGDINIEGVLESNGHEVMFKAVDSTDDGHNDQIIGYTAEDGDVLIIDHVLEGAYEVSILGPIDDVEGETHTDVDITAHVAVTDGDGDMAYADLAIHIDIDMHQVLETPALEP